MPQSHRSHRQVYAALGRELKRGDATPLREILQAQQRLSVSRSLGEYYRVAGRASDFHSAYDLLLPPAEWELDRGRLIFMEENQGVVLYGARFNLRHEAPVEMRVSDEGARWVKVCASTRAFLQTMLCWNVAFAGALDAGGTAPAPAGLRKQLDRDWPFVGEVNRMRAYLKPRRVVCWLKWGDHWRIFAGATDDSELERVERELKLAWDDGGS
jgi:hypothetical protein